MNIYWVQGLGLLVTFAASVLAYWKARIADRASSEATHRTLSLSELEKALTFTGEQLEDLRTESTRQRDEIRTLRVDFRKLQIAHQECQRDKRQLHRELLELRRHGGPPHDPRSV